MGDPFLPSKEVQLKALQLMVVGRIADERAVNLQRQGRIGFYAQMEGQEAAQVGCALALAREDWLLPAYRELCVALARGMPLKMIFDQIYGNANDVLKGRQMPCHYGSMEHRFVIASSPVGTQAILAVGLAMASRYKGEKVVSVPFFGDGATSSNDFHSGLNFAGVYKASVIFFCQNNGWAISLPRQKQTRSATLAMKAESYGFPGVQVDGNDFVAVYRAVKEARERAVEGNGPTFIEAVTYRMGPHSTSDDPGRYRPAAEVVAWKEKDPIERLRKQLIEVGVLTEQEAEKMREEARNEVRRESEEAEKAPFPDPLTLFDEVFRERERNLEEERSEFVEMLQKGILKP